jgi:hypothetical protein
MKTGKKLGQIQETKVADEQHRKLLDQRVIQFC